MRRVLVVAGLITGSVLFAAPADAGGGCHQDGASASGDTVELAMNCMNPRVLRSDAAGTITFVNRDAVVHNLWGDGWGVDELAAGESVAQNFPSGTHVYSCTLHPSMVGAIVVGDGIGSPAAKVTPVRAVSVAGEGDGSGGWLVGGLVGLAAGVAGTLGLRRVRGRIAA